MNITVTCPCPGSPHPDGDTVTLADKLDFQAAAAVKYAIVIAIEQSGGLETPEVMALASFNYLVYGIEGWTFVDDEGPIAIDKDAIRAFIREHTDVAGEIAEVADELYTSAVILPLARMGQKSSPPTPITASTSATNGSGPRRPRRSRRSSTTTTRTDATATTSSPPDGGSNSSRSSASEAA